MTDPVTYVLTGPRGRLPVYYTTCTAAEDARATMAARTGEVWTVTAIIRERNAA